MCPLMAAIDIVFVSAGAGTRVSVLDSLCIGRCNPLCFSELKTSSNFIMGNHTVPAELPFSVSFRNEHYYYGGLFLLTCQDFGRMFDHSFPACAFCCWSGDSTRTLIPLFMPGSVHSGSAGWDDCVRMFPDKLRVSSFPDRFPHYAWTAAYSVHSDLIGSNGVFRCNLPPAFLAEWPGSSTCHCGNTGVERTPNKSQHTKFTLEKKILPPLLPGFELVTFRSRFLYQRPALLPIKILAHTNKISRLPNIIIILVTEANTCFVWMLLPNCAGL